MIVLTANGTSPIELFNKGTLLPPTLYFMRQSL